MSQKPFTSENTRSMPCIELPAMLVSSDHSISFKSFNSAPTNDPKSDEPTESRVSVKALIDKFGSFQERSSVDDDASDFDVRKKPFTATVRENLETPCNECKNMEGDVKRVDDYKDTVKNHVFEVFTASTHFEQNPKPLRVDKNAVRTVHFGLKNSTPGSDEAEDNMDKRFWRNIVAMAKVNRVYHQCMSQIMNRKKFPSLKDVREHVTLALKKGEESEFMESELITYIKEYLERFSVELNGKLDSELNKTPLLSHHTRLSVLQMKLEEIKRKMKSAENSVALLLKENKDLLNTLNSYGHENIHRVSLEKLLKSEQQKNDKLKDTIASVFEKKMLSYNAKKDYAWSNNSYES